MTKEEAWLLWKMEEIGWGELRLPPHLLVVAQRCQQQGWCHPDVRHGWSITSAGRTALRAEYIVESVDPDEQNRIDVYGPLDPYTRQQVCSELLIIK